MTMIMMALHPSRLAQFAAVWRREGARIAMARAWRHLALLLRGLALSDVGRAPYTSGARLAFEGVWWDLAEKDAFHTSRAPSILTRNRTVALIGDLNLPQCRKYRVEQLDELWALGEVEYRFAHYEDLPRCRELMQGATHLIVYRVPSCDLLTMYLYEARRLRLPVMYDVDDPIFSVAAYETYGNMRSVGAKLKEGFLRQAPFYAEAMNLADALSLSTPGLVLEAERHAPRPAFLRRNFADRTTLRLGTDAMRRARRRDGFTLAVASGSRGHDADLAIIADDLAAFLAAAADRRLLLLGHLDASGLPARVRDRVSTVPFRDYARYLAALAAANVVAVPLADDAFNRCKSAVRVLDAGAVGIPSLVSDVGDLPAAVDDRTSGLVIQTGGWRDALERCAADARATREMGMNARRMMETRWSAAFAPHVIDPELRRWVVA